MLSTKEEFKAFVSTIENGATYVKPIAFGLGVRRQKGEKTLDVLFSHINYETAYGTAALFIQELNYTDSKNGFKVITKENLKNIFDKFSAFHSEIELHSNILLIKKVLDASFNSSNYYTTDLIVYFYFDKDASVETAEEGYFKLQCLSKLLVKPHGIKLDGVFGKLNNIAWTNKGPILPEDVANEKLNALFNGEELVVSHVDKFPYMVNYHIPEGVRIASGSQVRLGAYLSSGTTVMPAGYINFNAGTLGNAMVEGRISGGVVIGANTDIGGGASIMGTLSGGNKNVISLGEKCLLGANSGTGISLGFGCTIEAGLYITASSKIHLFDSEMNPVNLHKTIVKNGENIVKAMALNGMNNLLFIRDSISGTIICKPNPKTVELNAALHAKV
jgi:2,3,4,5-tetrahydropyridine-2-carboxylate N-succinyltransferase